MNDSKLDKIEIFIKEQKISEAQFELSKLGKEYEKNPDYLFLRGKVFYLNKLYYAAIDALLIALEFEQSEKIYNLLAVILTSSKNFFLFLSLTNGTAKYLL